MQGVWRRASVLDHRLYLSPVSAFHFHVVGLSHDTGWDAISLMCLVTLAGHFVVMIGELYILSLSCIP